MIVSGVVIIIMIIAAAYLLNGGKHFSCIRTDFRAVKLPDTLMTTLETYGGYYGHHVDGRPDEFRTSNIYVIRGAEKVCRSVHCYERKNYLKAKDIGNAG